MDKALEILANIIDKLKVKEVITALLIACIVILFVPDRFLGMLGLVDWRNKHRTEIGGVLLFCGILCLIWIVTWIFNSVRSGNRAAKRVSRSYLKKLISTDEKEFLIRHYFNCDTNEFDSCGKVDMTSGYLAPLTQAMIIYQATRVGRGVNHWAFNLHPDVRIYLNKAVKRGKIVVSRNGEYKWNL
ncbi:super-infection exclusion protein B [Lachnospiraceae bacterium 29-91]